jgi:stalled ribosome alternative rescue factor ArfA
LGIKAIALVVAMCCGAFTVSTASAITVAKPHGIAAVSPILHQAAFKKKTYHKRKSFGSHNRRPPANWHRYNKRPGDWSRRGCMAIGPIWWCP